MLSVCVMTWRCSLTIHCNGCATSAIAVLVCKHDGVCVKTVCCSGQVDELSAKYQAVGVEEVEEGWKDVYERSLTSCMHGAACQQGPSCQVCMPASDMYPFECATERLTHCKSIVTCTCQTRKHSTRLVSLQSFACPCHLCIHPSD